MELYLPEKLPLKVIDWERHVPNIVQANSHLARFDGILLTIPFSPQLSDEHINFKWLSNHECLKKLNQYPLQFVDKLANLY